MATDHTATVRSNTLTDGSITYDVVYLAGEGVVITIGAVDRNHANDVCNALNRAAFVYVDRTVPA